MEDDNGRKRREIHKSGIKMKAENETAYEPDLLVLMSRHEDILGDEKKVWREAMVIKDRTTLIDGKTFKNPSFSDFEPFVLQMLDGSIKEVSGEEQELNFKDHEHQINSNKKQRDIALDKIKSYFELMQIGTGKAEKALKVKILIAAFGTPSWQEIESLQFKDLNLGLGWVEMYKTAYMEYVETCANTKVPFAIERAEELIDETEALATTI
jgi:hypothetical protein